jgi:hypothetical protein
MRDNWKFGASSNDVDLHCDFLELYLKVQQCTSFVGMLFFSIGSLEKRLCSPKQKIEPTNIL